MDTLKSTKVDWKKIIAVASFVLLTATAVGLGVWYYMDQQYQAQMDIYEEELNGLKLQPNDTEEDEGTSPNKSVESEAEVVIAYERAGLFEGNEKSDIETKIIEPYIYYANNVEGSSKVVAVLVDKYPADERPSNNWFSITAIMENGGTSGWLAGNGGTIEYWKPECMETCQLTQAYVDTYPNNLPADYEIK